MMVDRHAYEVIQIITNLTRLNYKEGRITGQKFDC